MTTLLRTGGRVESLDSKTVRTYELKVPEGVEALSLRFDYQPRKALDREKNAALVEAALHKHNARRKVELDAAGLEAQRERLGAPNFYRALNNLMNVVLVDPAGVWRGRWDRNPSSDNGELVLTARESSKGFLPGAITAGTWTVAVECHGVFGEPVTYELEVRARGPLHEEERRRLGAKPATTPRPSRAKRSGPGWYFGELHSHTVHSDGLHELTELAHRAAALGIDFLCLTDHNTTSGLVEPLDLPVTLLPGCELTTFHGHHPIYGLTDIVPWHQDGRVRPMEELAPEIRARGGIVSVAHPFKIGDPICTGCRMRDDLEPDHFDLIEVWYRDWEAPETDNLTAYALWNSYWARGKRVTAVAARDWHGPGQEAPFPGGVPFTGVWAEENTPEAILDGLKKGRVIMSGGPVLDFRLRANDGREATVGREIHADCADVVVRLEGLERPAELRVFRSGELVRVLNPIENGEHLLPKLAAAPGWYRVEAWKDGLPRVITNHIVLV